MVFADTNIVVYAYGVDPAKVAPAKAIVSASPVISTQVINEFHNIARRKLGDGQAFEDRLTVRNPFAGS